jgi:hypothetical protein
VGVHFFASGYPNVLVPLVEKFILLTWIIFAPFKINRTYLYGSGSQLASLLSSLGLAHNIEKFVLPPTPHNFDCYNYNKFLSQVNYLSILFF